MWIAELSITVFKQSPRDQLALNSDQTPSYFGHLSHTLMHRPRERLYVQGRFQFGY